VRRQLLVTNVGFDAILPRGSHACAQPCPDSCGWDGVRKNDSAPAVQERVDADALVDERVSEYGHVGCAPQWSSRPCIIYNAPTSPLVCSTSSLLILHQSSLAFSLRMARLTIITIIIRRRHRVLPAIAYSLSDSPALLLLPILPLPRYRTGRTQLHIACFTHQRKKKTQKKTKNYSCDVDIKGNKTDSFDPPKTTENYTCKIRRRRRSSNSFQILVVRTHSTDSFGRVSILSFTFCAISSVSLYSLSR